MGRRSSFTGYVRQYGGGSKRTTPAPVPSILFLPTFATTAAAGVGQATGKILPKGARIIEVLFNGAATGGTNPTFDIGFEGALDAIVDGGDADGGLGRTLVLGAPLAANSEVLVGNGGAVSTGGQVSAAIVYVMNDDHTE